MRTMTKRQRQQQQQRQRSPSVGSIGQRQTTSKSGKTSRATSSPHPSLPLYWQPQLPLVQHPVSSTNSSRGSSSSATTVSPFPCHFWALLAIVARPETRSAPQRCHIFLFSARLVFNFICARSTWNTLCSRRCQATFPSPPPLLPLCCSRKPMQGRSGWKRAGQGRVSSREIVSHGSSRASTRARASQRQRAPVLTNMHLDLVSGRTDLPSSLSLSLSISLLLTLLAE